MKPLNKRSFTYNESESSEAEQLRRIDKDIDAANIVSKTGKRTTDRYETKPTEIFQQTPDILRLHRKTYSTTSLSYFARPRRNRKDGLVNN